MENTMFCTLDPGDLHLGQLKLDQLEVADALAPQRAALRVIDAQAVTLVNDAEGQDRHPHAFAGEAGPRAVPPVTVLVFLGVPEQTVRAEPDVVEEQLAGG
jgi:hypothetical protein